ncbi:hypothetical protein [Pseudomonas phage PhiPizzaParty]|nr:hypothetical protein [Pseudomonas aeruginosa]WNV50281.1 hypothetical protein [Pseudomonas phage PhiPizzaParty]
MLFKKEVCIENILVLEKLYIVTNRKNNIYPNPEVTYKDIKNFTKTYGKIPMDFLGPLLHEIVEREDYILKEKEAQEYIDKMPIIVEHDNSRIVNEYTILNYIIPVTTHPNLNNRPYTINLYKYVDCLENTTKALKHFRWTNNKDYNFLKTVHARLLDIHDIMES